MADIHSNLLNSFISDPRANSAMQHDAEIILRLTKQLREVEKKRDELLAALKEAVEWARPMEGAPIEGRPVWFDIARTAIAKAEQS